MKIQEAMEDDGIKTSRLTPQLPNSPQAPNGNERVRFQPPTFVTAHDHELVYPNIGMFFKQIDQLGYEFPIPICYVKNRWTHLRTHQRKPSYCAAPHASHFLAICQIRPYALCQMRACATTLAPEMTPTERNALRDALAVHELNKTHLEIGTAAGGTLCDILVHYRDNLHRDPPPFIVIDPMSYFPDQHATVRTNLERNGLDPSHPQFIQSTSAQAFQQMEADPPVLDFILVDGNHKIHYVMEDLMWSRHLQTGGLLCLHDCGPHFPGVQLNARRFLRKYPNYEVHTHAESLLILKKNSPSQQHEVSRTDQLWAKCLAPMLQLKASLKKRLAKG